MVKIGMIGTGYVGLVTGVCLSDFGWQVICADRNEEIVRQLQNGYATIYEPGLEDLLSRNAYYRRIRFTADIDEAVRECDVIFIAVGKFYDLDLKGIKQKPFCKSCDWECFRDPSEQVGFLIEAVRHPIKAIRGKEADYRRLWNQDIKYYNQCSYFNGRKMKGELT